MSAERIRGLTGCVLAGGQSRRFGRPKALAPWAGGTMIGAVVDAVTAVCPRTIVVGRALAALTFLDGVELVRDRFRTTHPLGGLLGAFEATETEHLFVAACDTPLLQTALIRALWAERGAVDAVVVRWQGRPQPFAALYRRSSLPAVRRALGAGQSLGDLLASLSVGALSPAALAAADPDGLSFRDADTPVAHRRLAALAARRATVL